VESDIVEVQMLVFFCYALAKYTEDLDRGEFLRLGILLGAGSQQTRVWMSGKSFLEKNIKQRIY